MSAASAGRVLIIPRGNYNPIVTYYMLDLVKDGKSSYIAKKTVNGIAPHEDTTEEYWQLMATNEDTEQDVQDAFDYVFGS